MLTSYKASRLWAITPYMPWWPMTSARWVQGCVDLFEGVALMSAVFTGAGESKIASFAEIVPTCMQRIGRLESPAQTLLLGDARSECGYARGEEKSR